MSKSIRMQRSELVWETRVNYFTKSDWDRIKERLGTFVDRAEANQIYTWVGHQVIIYNRVKDLTFDDVLADFAEFEKNYESDRCIKVELINKRYNGETWTYNQFLHDLIIEWMREDNYDSDIVDTEYANDSEEYVEILKD